MIDVKEREYEKVRKLVLRGSAPKAEADALRSEIAVLKTKTEDTETVRKWKEELERIDKVVVPEGARKSTGSPTCP